MKNELLYINGEYIKSSSHDFIDVLNPATEEVISKVARANEYDINQAVKAASKSFKAWSKTSLSKRIEYIEKFKEWALSNEERFINTMTAELGVPYNFSKETQFMKQIKRIENFIKQVQSIKFKIKMKNGFVRYEPIGVIAAITPWNYPLGQIVQKVIPALLTGNTVVLKPASITPLTAHLFVEGFDEINLPKGVLNLITGDGSEVGNILNKHKDISKVSFTGSTKAGKIVAKDALDSVKNITLELGGKSPAIFIDESHIKNGVKTVLDSIFLNTGQTCSALSRVVVLKNIKKNLIKEILKEAKNYKVGDPKLKETDIGPMSSKEQYDKVISYINKGVEEGAKIIFGEIKKKYSKGYFINPLIFDKVTKDMAIHKDEIFGPVLVIEEANNIEEAIEIANDVEYGLSAAVFGEENKVLDIADEIKSGQVIINSSNGDINLPFGGYKQSGLGREGGIFGLMEYLEVKSIHLE
ncbi:aldehyde dehydrogenase family protein [Anaerococcus porci]|uniref:aldehyde dehydrogenase family protein n=1 Tax=Anaerococcus porci TaxID=2652269 RepID=UPI002A7584FF|nr:aldehyde dehydrogenase family protein [Anaerococcus porci]MDY3006104.1 aldehyde dehydrogenase family protein [Anaerococcus porci]